MESCSYQHGVGIAFSYQLSALSFRQKHSG
jgi:hypothetical protein